MTATAHQRQQSMQRKRVAAARKKAGMVRLAVVASSLWLSEALARSGYGHADADDRKSLQDRLQALVDALVAEAMREA